jgi:hypothetical protein
MCQAKPGMRCSKHANQALKSSFVLVKKAKDLTRNKKLTFEERDLLVKQAEAAHGFHIDMYYASPIMFNLISSNASFYPMANYLQKNLRKALKNSRDFNPDTPIGIGSKIKVNEDGGFSKDSESSKSVVRSPKNSYIIWDEANPMKLKKYSKEGVLENTFPLTNKNIAYGFETKKKPNIHWAIWYSKKFL